MKLLFCLECNDIFNLTHAEKTCSCGNTKGKYINDMDAEFEGSCEPIGFANSSFVDAMRKQRIENRHYDGNKDTCCKGAEFNAFFIPAWAKSIKKIK